MPDASAPAWRRVVAFVIDYVIIILPVLALYAVFVFSTREPSLAGLTKISLQGLRYSMWSQSVFCVGYFMFFLSSRWQATLGNRLLSIHLATAGNFQRVSAFRALFRWAAFYAPVLLLMLVLSVVHLPGPDYPLSQSEIGHYQEIGAKKSAGTVVSAYEDRFYMQVEETVEETNRDFENRRKMWERLAYLLLLIMPATIPFTRERVGIHDRICKTRMVKGRVRIPLPLAGEGDIS